MTLDSTFKTSYLRLVLGCYRHNIASSHWGSVGVGIVVGDIVVVVVLGWGMVEVAGVVIVTSIVGVGTVYLNMVTGTELLDFVGPILVHHYAFSILLGLIDLSFHLDGCIN